MDDDKKWLYDKFSKQGLNIGSYEDFENSLNNEEDRKWYHSKAQGMGLNVGDYDSFNSLFGAQQQAQPQQPEPQGQQEAVSPVSSPERNGTEQQEEQVQPVKPDSIAGHPIPTVNAPNLERRVRERQQKELPEAERGEAFQQDEDAAVTRIDELYKAKEQELREAGQLRVHQNFADPYAVPTYDMPEDVDYDAAVLKQAKRLYADAEKTRKAAEGGRGFGKGLADSFTVANWDMGISDFQKNAALLTAAQKVQDGQELTEAEDLLLDAAAHKMASDMYYGNFLGRGYKAGLTTGQSLPFMLEFMLNPVSGTAEGGGSVIGKALAKKIGDKIAKEGLAKTAATAAGRVAGDLASAAVMTGTTGALGTTADALGRRTGDIKFRETEDGIKFDGVDGGEDTFFGAFAKAYGARTIENFSEMFGEYFRPIGSAVGGKVRSLNKSIGLGKVNDFIDNIGTAEWMESVNHFLNKTHWNGVLGEFGEEIVGGVMNALTVGDQSLGEVFSKDNLIDTFLGVGAFGGFVSAIKTVGYRTPKQQMEDKRKRLYNEGAKAFMSQDDWTQATTEIDAASEDELRQYINDFNATGYYTPEQAQAILQYAFAREERLGADKARAKKEAEEPAMASLDAIYEAAVTEMDPEAKRAAKVEFDNALAALVDAGVTDEQIKELDSDPSAVPFLTDNPSVMDAMDRYTAARAALTGVNDSINAQMSEDMDRAYNDIMSKSTEDGIYYDITLKDGTKVGLKSGVLAKAEDGSVDRLASSDKLYISMPDGSVQMISPRQVREFTMAPAADLYEMAQQQIRQSYQQQLADEINTPTKQEVADSLTGEDEPFTVNGQTVMGTARQVTADGHVIVQFDEDVQLGDRIGRVHPVSISDFVQMRQGIVAPTQAVEEQPQEAAEQPVQGEEAAGQQDVQPEAEVQPQPAQSTTERDFRGRPMPVREDGKVDQKALFQQDPEAWIEWNNRQMNDDGQDSRNYIEGSISREEKKIADLQKKYDKADDFDERDELRGQIRASRERIAALQQAQESVEARARIRSERDIDPLTVDEVVSQYIKAYKGSLDKANFQRETGYSDTDFKGFVGGFVTDNPQAIGVNRLAEIIKESDDTGLTASMSDMDLRDAIIDFMQRVGTWGDVNNYIANNRAAQQAEQERAALQQAEDERQRQEEAAGTPTQELINEERERQQQEFEQNTADYEQMRQQEIRLSDEVDENGKQFVLSSQGNVEFGFVPAESGLTPAPILLSEGEITNPATNDGYGLVHIEARHGEQIRKAGFGSVVEFVENVAQNYEVIRRGKDRDGNQTYMLQLTDRHNNTLMVELSGDGTYWNINTAGIFKTTYGAKRDVVYNRPTSVKQPAEAVEVTQEAEQGGTQAPSSRNNTPTQQVAEDKDSEISETQAKISEEEAKVDTEPTEAQKEAGNYRKGHIKLDGFDITIEQPKGSVRSGVDAQGREWSQTMNNTYGYIRGTEGVDGDHIDVFLSDNPEEGNIFVVDQLKQDGSFDEHKVMYGFPDAEAARQAYLSNYEEGWTGLGAITEVTKDEFRKWVDSSHRKTKPFSEYKSVKPEGDVLLGQNSPEIAQKGAEIAQESPEIAQSKETVGPQAEAANAFAEAAGVPAAQPAEEKPQVQAERPAFGQVHKKVEALAKALNTPFVVHDDVTTVTDADAMKAIMAGEGVKGWFEADGSVHIYAPNATSLRDVEQTVFHELVGHRGMRELLGEKEYADLCRNIALRLPSSELLRAERAVSHLKQMPGEDSTEFTTRKMVAAVDEYIASMAERMTQTDFEKAPSIWKRFVNFIRGIIEGKGVQLEITNDEISELLRQSYKRLAEGRTAEFNEKLSPAGHEVMKIAEEHDALWREWLQDKSDSVNRENFEQQMALSRRMATAMRDLSKEDLDLIATRAKSAEALEEANNEINRRTEQERATQVAKAIAAVQVLPAVKAKPAGKLKLYDWVGTDKNRPILSGVFHDKGYAVANNAFIIVADKPSYDPKNEGKVIAKDGGEIQQGNQKYPDWRSVTDIENWASAPMDFNGLRDFIASVKDFVEKKWAENKAKNGSKAGSKKDALENTIVYIRVGDEGKLVKLGYLTRFADYAAAGKADKIFMSDNGMLLGVETKDGRAVMMTVMPRAANDRTVDEQAEDEYQAYGAFSYWPEDGQETKPTPEAEEQEPEAQPEAEEEEQEEPVAEEIRKEDEATAEAKKNPQVSIASNQEKYEDFGEKIGMARKDVATSGFKRKTGEDSRPAWRKKYRSANVRMLTDEEMQSRDQFGMSTRNFVELPLELGKGTDYTQPFVGFYEEEKKAYFGKRYIKHYITGQDRRPIIFTSQEQFEATVPVFEANDQGFRVRKVGDKYKIARPASNGKMVEYAEFGSEEEAVAYLTSPEGATSLLNRKRENYELPALERLTRNNMPDYRGGRNITPDDIQNTFMFRGGEFGNWLNAEERQQFLNYAYDALMDLAHILGIQPSALSLNGELSIAFGARGRQGAVAHYEPQRAVINLTKMKGAGSLAHEWAHALDNYFGLMDAKQQRDRESKADASHSYMSEGPNWKKGAREEMRQAFRDVMTALQRKTVTRKIELEDSQKRVDSVRKTVEREIDNYKTRLRGGRTTYKYNRKTKKREEVRFTLTQEQIEQFEKLARQLETDPTFEWKFDPFRAQGFRAQGDVATKLYDLVKDVMPDRKVENYGPLNDLFYYTARLHPQLERLEKAKKGESETVVVETKVKEDSLWFDRDRAGEYFSKEVEMFARAFEAFVNRRMEQQEQSSDYLVYEKGSIYQANWEHNPYPAGDELVAVSKAFDKLFSSIREREENGRSVLFRKVTDPETLDRLNSEPTFKAYRAMQVIDGNLYPPMSAKVDGQLREPTELGEWEEAVEDPTNVDDKGRYKLDKGNKKSLKARYNPYIHVSRSPLNDQFTEAYNRPNLVVVEVEVPESELTSGYKADKAKDAVGEMDWHSGPVSSKLPDGKKRKVILTRWARPVRIVPDSEVAEKVADMLKGEDITVPYNVVTPSLRAELEKQGVTVSDKPSGTTRFRIANENQQMFISNARKALDGIKQEKATPEQWLKMLEKSGGLKAAEDKWLGLSQWLRDSRKKSLTKDEVAEFIDENQIQIEEKRYRDRDDINQLPENELAQEFSRAYAIDVNGMTDEPFIDTFDIPRAIELYNKNHEDQIEEPEDPTDISDADYDKLKDYGEELLRKIESGELGGDAAINSTRLGYTTEGLENKREIALTVPTIKPWQETDQIHFGDAGDGRSIGWIRFGDAVREDVEKPRRVLFIDEIQSNRHQVGRKRGYADDTLLKEAVSRHKQALQEYDDYYQQMIQKYGYSDFNARMSDEERKELSRLYAEQSRLGTVVRDGGFDPMENAEYRQLVQEWETLNDILISERAKRQPRMLELNNLIYSGKLSKEELEKAQQEKADLKGDIYDYEARESYAHAEMESKRLSLEREFEKQNRDKVPAAPFEKNWHELAMKRMLRYAAENGYDYVAWTSGDQQAERYHIGGVLNSVRREEHWDIGEKRFALKLNGNGTQYITTDNDGKVLISIVDDFRNKNLSDIVGKEIAARMLQMKEGDRIEGEGLRVGGDGMRGFYDEILPRFMNKYGKQWGVKVEDMDFPSLESGITAHAVPVNEEMKQSVMAGQTMFRITKEERETDVQFAARSLREMRKLGYKQLAHELEIHEGSDKNPKADYGDGLIRIFAKPGRDYESYEKSFFHENNHFFLEENGIDGTNPAIREMLDSFRAAFPDKMKEWEDDVRSMYDGSSYADEEVFVRLVSNMMSGRITEQVMPFIPDAAWELIDNFYKAIGYDTAKEANNRGVERGAEEPDQGDDEGAAGDLRLVSPEAGGEEESGRRDSDREIARAVASMTGRSEDDVLREMDQRRKEEYQSRFRKVDEEYAAAVEQDDRKKVEALIRQAAKIAMPNTQVVDKKGNPKIVYHGTVSERAFNTFNDGDIYMVSKDYHAQQYTHRRGMISVSPYRSGRVMPVFVNLENPLVMDANRRLWNNLLPPWPVYPANPVSTDDIAKYAREHGYDGVIIKRVRDNMFSDDPTYADDIIAFDSSQIKSAGAEYENVKNWHYPWENYDKVVAEIGPTYDDEGRLIPLSERFDPSKSDIRFRKAPLPDDLIGRYEARVDDVANKVRESHQDSMLALKILQEEIAKATGRPLESFEDAYMAENQLSSVNSAEKEFYTRNYFRPMIEAVGDLMDASGFSYGDIIKYVIAKHGLERNEVFHDRDERAEGKPIARRDYSGLTALMLLDGENAIDLDEAEQRAQEFVDKVENAAANECVKLWTKVKDATKKALYKSWQSGIMTRSEYENVRDMFNFYVPLRGFDEETAEQHYEYLDHKSSPFSPAMRTAKGRTSIADDPFATIGNMWESTVQQGNNNLVKQKFLNMVLNRPNDLVTVKPMWYTYDPVADEWTQAVPQITNDMSREDIQEAFDSFQQRMEALEQQGLASKKKPNRGRVNIPYRLLNKQDQEHMVVVKSGGKEWVLVINGNPRAAQAINGLTNPDRQDFLAKMAKANRWMAANFTTRSPKFVLRNLIRDTTYSLFSIDVKEDSDYNRAFRGNLMRNYGRIWNLMRRFKAGEFDEVDDNDLPETERLFKEFMMNGGETGYTQLKRVDEYKKMVNRIIGDQTGEKLHTVKNAGRAVEDFVGFANRCVEDICRLSAYMTSRQMGRDIQTSVANAKDISVNFNKKGSGEGYGSSFARAAYLFYNAGVQGLQNFVGLRGKSRKHWTGLNRFDVRIAETLTLGAMIPFLNGIISAAVGGDDDEYADLPDWVRRNNLVLGGGGFYLTIPLSIELRAFYGIGDIAYMTMAGRMKDHEPWQVGLDVIGQVADIMPLNPVEGVVTNKGKNLGEGLLLSLVPDMVAPVAQAALNTDFTGKPIYKKQSWNESAPAYTKAYAGTSKVLVKSAEFLNNVTGGDQYGPGAVNVNPAVVEHLLEGYFGGLLTFAEETAKSVEMTWDSDMRQLRNVPLANVLFQKNDERTASSYVNDMYWHYKQEADMTEKRARGYRSEGDIEKAARIASSDAYQRARFFKQADKQVKDLQDRLKETDDKAMQDDLRRRIAELKRTMVEKLTEMD